MVVPRVSIRGTTVSPLASDAPTRSLDPCRPGEATIAAAVDAGRDAAVARLGAAIEGVDLDAAVRQTRHRRPSHGRLTAEGERRLDLVHALDDFLSVRHLQDPDADVGLARLVQARDGIDRTAVARPPLVVPPTTPGAALRGDAAAIVRALSDGLSVKPKAIDEHVPWAGGFVEDVERVVGRRSGILVFLSGPGALGWGAHFAYHDLLVVQLAGSKHWTLFEPVEPNALWPHTPYRVSDEVDWEGWLRPGDVMHLPRGWGHRVVGGDEWSVHVTLSLGARPAAQVLETVAAASVSDPVLRADLPFMGTADHHRMVAACSDRWIDRFFSAWRARMPARPDHRLSSTIDAWGSLAEGTLAPDLPLRLSAPGGVQAVVDASPGVVLAVAGHRIDLAPRDLPAFARLMTGEVTSPQELAGLVPDADDLVRTLLLGGVVHIADPAPPAAPGRWATRPQPGLVEPTLVVHHPDAPISGLRAPRAGDGSVERALAEAMAEGRAAARARLEDAFSDLDLDRALGGQDGPRVLSSADTDRLAVAVDAIVAGDDRAGDRTDADPTAGDLFQPAYSWYSPMVLDPRRVAERLGGGTGLTLRRVDLCHHDPSGIAEDLEQATGCRVSLHARLGPVRTSIDASTGPRLALAVRGAVRWKADRGAEAPLPEATALVIPSGAVAGLITSDRQAVVILVELETTDPDGEPIDGALLPTRALSRFSDVLRVAVEGLADSDQVRLTAPGGAALWSGPASGTGTRLVLAGAMVTADPQGMPLLLRLLAGDVITAGDVGPGERAGLGALVVGGLARVLP